MPRKILVTICLILGLSASALAKTSFILEKQEAKAAGRWSLAEWLEQRDRMRLMDLWLALHSPSPYEFYLGAKYNWGRVNDGAYYSGWNLSFAGYASIFGLELQRELSTLDPRLLALFHLRIFGKHAQGTNITLQGGVKQEHRTAGQLWNPLAGVALTIYITRYFGIEGLYRHYFQAENSLGRYTGDRMEVDAFIDFKFVRFFGGYFYDAEDHIGDKHRIFKGGMLGSKLFF